MAWKKLITSQIGHPSGTAITLAEDIIEKPILRDGKCKIHRQNQFHSVHREGEVPGIHQVEYSSPIEPLKFVTKPIIDKDLPLCRIAAEWILGKKGVFEWRMLNLSQ